MINAFAGGSEDTYEKSYSRQLASGLRFELNDILNMNKVYIPPDHNICYLGVGR
jgi:hypothetical protein